MEHHISKAKKKGFELTESTTIKEVVKIDTIRDVLTNDIIRLDTMYRTITEVRQMPIYIRLTRNERRALRDSMQHVENVHKLENKRLKDSLNVMRRVNRNDNRTEVKVEKVVNRKSRWWLWLLIGVGLGVFRKKLLTIALRLIKLL